MYDLTLFARHWHICSICWLWNYALGLTSNTLKDYLSYIQGMNYFGNEFSDRVKTYFIYFLHSSYYKTV